MGYENIIFTTEGSVGIIKFNRPKALNAINVQILEEVNEALNLIEAEPAIRVLILTGEGDKAFVAGADISHMVTLSPLELREFSRKGQDFMFRLESLPIPVIACVNGFALGGGNEIAMACDFIYASEKGMHGLWLKSNQIEPQTQQPEQLPNILTLKSDKNKIYIKVKPLIVSI